MGAPTGHGIPRCEPLDGLRGLAVVAVVAYHLGYLHGGFLGVDAFFVLSGYLITDLLVRELRADGTIGLRAFWSRRARRLLPALLLVLIAVAGYALWAASAGELSKIRGDSLATLFYIANWHDIAAGANYFDQFRAPSPLAHVWSLAIEEQFYVIWPMVVLAVVRFGRRAGHRVDPMRRLDALLVVTVALAVASATSMIVRYDPDAGPGRVYLGTDTRVAAILIGAGLALIINRFELPTFRAYRVAREVGGLVALLIVGAAWTTLRGADSWLYRGGFPLLGLMVGVLILAATAPGGIGPVSRLLALPPLRVLGRISYGVYLWHWPVIVYLNSTRMGFDGPRLALLRLAVTLAIATVSYHLVEQPVRLGLAPARIVRFSAVGAPVACITALLLATTAVTKPPTPFDREEAIIAKNPRALIVAKDLPTTTTTTTSPAASAPTGVPTTSTTVEPRTKTVLLVGDSGAYYLGDGLQASQSFFHASVINRGTINCGIARGDGRLREPSGEIVQDPDGCGRYLDRWKLYLAATPPDIALLTTVGNDTGSRMVEGQWRTDCDPVHDTWLRGQVVDAVNVLGSSGATVAITTIPYALNPTDAKFHQRETDCRNRVLRAAAKAVPGTRVVDLARWLCPTRTTCRVAQDGVVLRPDRVHFAGEGAQVAGAWVLSQLTSNSPATGPPPPPRGVD